eukprot:TRINITY_DN3943_c0_g1_i4.p1 TRINITY_DN3943_c0_g1~~TRINITY_DN3943_c0_g1_i4.p1  ORF type:complete len:296 (+),score=22.84 TRINITY_DN3943_c0_g1_i4:133-888(+)
MARRKNRNMVLQALCAKTKMCKYMETTGTCREGRRCRYAHREEEMRGLPDLLYTRPCRNFLAGSCSAGDQCNFAHADEDLAQRSKLLSPGQVPSNGTDSCGNIQMVSQTVDSLPPMVHDDTDTDSSADSHTLLGVTDSLAPIPYRRQEEMVSQAVDSLPPMVHDDTSTDNSADSHTLLGVTDSLAPIPYRRQEDLSPESLLGFDLRESEVRHSSGYRLRCRNTFLTMDVNSMREKLVPRSSSMPPPCTIFE